MLSAVSDFPLMSSSSSGSRLLGESLREARAHNPYEVEYEYPGDSPEMTEQEADTGLRLAAKVCTPS